MAISSFIKSIKAWASAGDTVTPESVGITRSEGWDDTYSQARSAGGKAPERSVFNRLLLEMTTGIAAFRDHGILVYDDEVTYLHPALVFGSDGNVYQTIGNNTKGVDPVGGQGHTRWVRLRVPDVAGRLLDVHVMTASGQYQAPADARRFEAIATAGGEGGSITFAGQAGGTAFGWWTEVASPTFTVVIGAAGASSGRDGGFSSIANGASLRLKSYGGGNPTNVDSSAADATYGSGNLLHVQGGFPAGSQNDAVAGSSAFWGGQGSFGSGGGEGRNGIVAARPGVVLIRSYS